MDNIGRAASMIWNKQFTDSGMNSPGNFMQYTGITHSRIESQLRTSAREAANNYVHPANQQAPTTGGGEFLGGIQWNDVISASLIGAGGTGGYTYGAGGTIEESAIDALGGAILGAVTNILWQVTHPEEPDTNITTVDGVDYTFNSHGGGEYEPGGYDFSGYGGSSPVSGNGWF